MKLWQKTNTTLSTLIEVFTVGKDKEFDLRLAAYDVEATSAHVQMLGECGLLTSAEVKQVVTGLKEIGKDVEQGTFQIEEGVEDIHSQIELLLTRKMGEVGKKIHAGRSRNDQVAVAIKLFLRSELQEIKKEMLELFDIL
ncbi:MAG: lyase family protein, partial [Chitinophagaceae bacterium]